MIALSANQQQEAHADFGVIHPRIACDIDDVIAGFTQAIFHVAGLPESRIWEVMKYDYRPVLKDFGTKYWPMVKDDEQFWMTLPVLETFIPKCIVAYVTARHTPVSVACIEPWLKQNNLPLLPIHHTVKDKLSVLIDNNYTGLVDDKAKHFEDCSWLPHSFLMSRPWNRQVETTKRIYRLEELRFRI